MSNLPDAPVDAHPDAETPENAPRIATFRLPPTGILAVISIAIGAVPIAFSGTPGLQAIYAIPALLAWWLFWSRTIVGPDGIKAYCLARPKQVGWDDISGLRVRDRHWVKAVRRDGSEVTLPAVRTRDLSLVATASGGRIDDPEA